MDHWEAGALTRKVDRETMGSFIFLLFMTSTAEAAQAYLDQFDQQPPTAVLSSKRPGLAKADDHVLLSLIKANPSSEDGGTFKEPENYPEQSTGLIGEVRIRLLKLMEQPREERTVQNVIEIVETSLQSWSGKLFATQMEWPGAPHILELRAAPNGGTLATIIVRKTGRENLLTEEIPCAFIGEVMKSWRESDKFEKTAEGKKYPEKLKDHARWFLIKEGKIAGVRAVPASESEVAAMNIPDDAMVDVFRDVRKMEVVAEGNVVGSLKWTLTHINPDTAMTIPDDTLTWEPVKAAA